MVSAISLGDSKILKISKDGKTEQIVKDDNFLYDGIQAGCLYVDDNDNSTIFTTDRRFEFDYGDRKVVYRPIISKSQTTHMLTSKDMMYYRGNNVINECVGCNHDGQELKNRIFENLNDYITERQFSIGEKLLICSDGIGDNFTNKEIGEIFVGKNDARQILMQIINEIYSIEEQKMQRRINNPNEYTIGNKEFLNVLKGNNDNSAGIIISNDEEYREGK